MAVKKQFKKHGLMFELPNSVRNLTIKDSWRSSYHWVPRFSISNNFSLTIQNLDNLSRTPPLATTNHLKVFTWVVDLNWNKNCRTRKVIFKDSQVAQHSMTKESIPLIFLGFSKVPCQIVGNLPDLHMYSCHPEIQATRWQSENRFSIIRLSNIRKA